MLGYVTDFISDTTPLLLPIIAIGLGIFIFLAIVGAFKHK
jgi:F0F1-type ATP synthase assembly protein I